MNYDGTFYAAFGDFMREEYLKYGFTRGTSKEVDFLVDLLALPLGSRILDIGCGPGRHSLELARRGYHTLGVDISAGFIEIANRKAVADGLSAEFRVADARQLEFPEQFDAAICLCEGAFGLAGDETGHRQILTGVRNALRPGGMFVLTVINAFSAVRQVKPGDSSFDPYTCTSVWKDTLRNPQGDVREVEGFTTAFSFRELSWLFRDSGLEVLAGYGCSAGDFQRKPLAVDDIEIMMVSRRT